ncbi:TlpA family protein disulfide reductase [Thomasclavelia saccharogumia]|uniref:TlpA family protein disulfide reductase n=1 Tax=Thomasclavelia saccharogumia TaxID=341225 RepID=UPI00068D5084|nr:TlpA disulfide reductase family protein [Thomasclavelia saccharogumia]
MTFKNKKSNKILIAGMLWLTALSACTSTESSNNNNIDKNNVSVNESLQSDFTGTSLGKFTIKDINGKQYNQDMFKDYDLTMINIFTTWCSPCVAEIPDLEKIHTTMAEQKVNVVGVVLDVLDEKGNIIQEYLEKAQSLAKQTGATYPILIPDSTYMNGRLIGIEAIPESFFVDKNGNIVGETYSGSRDFEDWKKLIEDNLADLKRDN